MKITKYIHACLLVETEDRVALFDPGSMSYSAFPLNSLNQLAISLMPAAVSSSSE